jgi:hypothetical protein
VEELLGFRGRCDPEVAHTLAPGEQLQVGPLLEGEFASRTRHPIPYGVPRPLVQPSMSTAATGHHDRGGWDRIHNSTLPSTFRVQVEEHHRLGIGMQVSQPGFRQSP